MKSDTERKKFYTESLHARKNRLHVHLSKDLRSKLKTKKRSILVRKNDRVKIMRGPNKGSEAKVARVSVLNRKVYLEGVMSKNARGKENQIPLEPSNLLLIGLEPTDERKLLFREEAFKKEEVKKEVKDGVKKDNEAKEQQTAEARKTDVKSETPEAKSAAHADHAGHAGHSGHSGHVEHTSTTTPAAGSHTAHHESAGHASGQVAGGHAHSRPQR